MQAFLKNFVYPLISFTVITVLFSCLLLTCEASEFNGLGEESGNLDKYMNRLYFTITTLSTVGYGDISPKSLRAKIITMILQALVTIGTVTTVVSLFKCS